MVEKQVSKISRREKRKLQLQEEILDVALELFSEKGFYAVSMQEVANRVEVGVGTLYNFFTSKEDLYQYLVQRHARDIFRALRKLLADEEGEDSLEIVRKYVATSWGMLSSDFRVLKLYLAVTQGARFSLRFQLDPEIKKEFDLLTEDLAAVIERAIAEKLFRPVGGRNLALMLQGLSHSFFLNWLQNPDVATVDQNVETILDLFYEGALDKGSDQSQSFSQ
ncbi:MAG: TetR/AcrR family transcriptional regulator [bacterium]